MSTNATGGAAFPEECNGAIFGGITKRDYFASKAMQAIVTKLPLIDQTGEFGPRVDDKIKTNLDVANSAYWYADAMLSERAKEKAPPKNVLSEVAAERARQVAKWGNTHDDGHSNLDFTRFINVRVGRSHDDALTRRMMIEIAALAVANIERIDRAVG